MNDVLDPRAWQLVVDGVMGGMSGARVAIAGDALRFDGVLRLDHGGGFASTRRSAPPRPVGAAPRGLRIVCRGDGHRYRLTAHTTSSAPAWHVLVDTHAGETTAAAFDFDAFRATWRGRAVPDAPALRAEAITQVGVMLTKDGHRDGRGPFALDVLDIGWWL